VKRFAHESDLAVAQDRPAPSQRPRVEEDDVAVVTANGEDTAVRAERLVEDTVAALVEDGNRGGARSREASRLLLVATESSRLTPSRASRSDRSRLGSVSAWARRRCAGGGG
jgi:hypothetical protein